nr:reverse transcriptase domain-containing protein [Tanacetum cinerariifolium]
MHTRSSSNLVGETSTNPKRRNRRHSKKRIESFSLEDTLVVTMADQRTMAELFQEPTAGYGDAIVIPAILAKNFELKNGLLNLVTSKQFYGFEKEDPHAHIPRIWLEKEPPRSILTWEDLVSMFINQFFPNSKTPNLHNEIMNFQQRFDESFCEAWDRFKDLLRACPITVLWNCINLIATLSDVVKAMLLQKYSPPASVKAVEEICVTCGGPHPYHQCLAIDGNIFLKYRDNIQGYVSAAAVVEWIPDMTKDTVQPSTKNIQPLVVQTQVLIDEPIVTPKPQPTIPYPLRVNKQKLCEKGDNLALKFVEIFRKLHFDLSFMDALLHLPKFATMFKSLLNNKENLFYLATTLLVECLALANLGASINLMPLSIWEKLSLPELTPTTGRALIDVYGEELTLRVDDESITLKFSKISKSGNPTPILDLIISLSSLSLTLFEGGDFILEEIEACLASKSIPPRIDDTDFDPEGDILLIEKLLNDDPSSPLPLKELNLKELQTVKSSIDDPPELELKDLPSHLEYLLTCKTKRSPPSHDLMEHLPTDVCLSAYVMLRARSKVGAVLGQRKTKHFQPIHYASKTMTDAQSHYTTTEKELLAVVYVLEKFRPYLVLSKTIVYTDHSALKYLLAKQDAKPILLWWILLLKEFDVIIRDKKGAKNLAADRLSRLENPHQSDLAKKEITETFPLETLGMVTFRGDSSTSWFFDIANYHAGSFIMKGM